ncbi:ribosome biogenesis protein SPATA5L1 [Toxorhynchites rutilus septentrionalis]|uniref:ribosome biogenesis protein SPATA5L1 n=1 Tax=Toxorhynchites rutilus septentrionalis TaxID=329112 RepID=UPI0024789796|nr:ribosome biogenesis protein SPATA5L1 [Toxorhynchites rutilus septentrionalis]
MCSIISVNHEITPDSGELCAAGQICEISRHLFKGGINSSNALAPGKLVICRFDNDRRFLCKLFAPPGRYEGTNTICFVAESVELFDDATVRIEDLNQIPKVKELSLVNEELCYFTKVVINLTVDCSKFELELIKDKAALLELVRDLIRPFIFCERCVIKLDDQENSNYGIVSAEITKTSERRQYGQIETDAIVEIDKINFHGSKTVNRKKLGGLADQRQAFRRYLNVNNNENILLAGPPGSGKYSLATQLVACGNFPIFEIRGLDFIKSYPGETELELRKTFERLTHFNRVFERTEKSILLVKDVDMLCPKLDRSRKGEDVANITRISSQFTALMDCYYKSACGILVVGTTSNIESLDTKVRRPGRFGIEISIRMPSELQRREIVEAVGAQQGGWVLEEGIMDEIVRRTAGYVGADLELLVHSIQRMISQHVNQDIVTVVDESIKKTRPSSLRNSIGLISDLSQTLDSVGGMEQLKKTLRVSVLGPLKRPESFLRFGMSPLKGILLYGPPGCAKTTIAKCLAAEARMTFVSVSAAEVYSPYVGDSEKLITKLFNQARMSAPAVIFLDEIDSLVGNRSMQGVQSNDVHIRVLSTLLTEMDGIGISVQSSLGSSEDSKNILVIAATNRPDMIDDALLRPGRLTKLIHVSAPDSTTRLEILRKVSEKIPLADDVCLQELARLTERYSGADLQNLCAQAALYAAALDENVQQVSMAHFNHALQKNRPSLTSSQIEWYAQYEAKHKFV